LVNGAVLHHTILSHEMDAARMLRVLRVGQEKLTDKAIKSAEKRVGPLRRQTLIPREDVIRRTIETFSSRAGGRLAEATLSADDLVRDTYGTRVWIYFIP
jgi:lipoate-protein ligase A